MKCLKWNVSINCTTRHKEIKSWDSKAFSARTHHYRIRISNWDRGGKNPLKYVYQWMTLISCAPSEEDHYCRRQGSVGDRLKNVFQIIDTYFFIKVYLQLGIREHRPRIMELFKTPEIISLETFAKFLKFVFLTLILSEQMSFKCNALILSSYYILMYFHLWSVFCWISIKAWAFLEQRMCLKASLSKERIK